MQGSMKHVSKKIAPQTLSATRVKNGSKDIERKVEQSIMRADRFDYPRLARF